MRKGFAIAAVLILAALMPSVADESKPAPRMGFRTFDVWVDSGEDGLAAYQVEITYDSKALKIVGLEGGETKAYADAPFFDRHGFESGRIVVAAFTTDKEGAPKGRTRVARIHVALATEDVEPELAVKLVTAAQPGGDRITPSVELRELIRGD